MDAGHEDRWHQGTHSQCNDRKFNFSVALVPFPNNKKVNHVCKMFTVLKIFAVVTQGIMQVYAKSIDV